MNLSDLVLAVAILIIVITPYSLHWIEQYLPDKQRAALHQFAKYAVQKVEQQFIGDNRQKKDLAVNIVENCFRSARLPVPELILIDAAVESFVYEMKQVAGPPEPEPEPASLRTGPLPIPPSPPMNTLPPTST